MNVRPLRACRRVLMLTASAAGAVLVLATPAVAHEALYLDQTDVVPRVAPLLVDGTDAINVFGELPRAAAVRSAQFTMQAGQTIDIAVTVPNLAPENALGAGDLPQVRLISPSGSVTRLSSDTRTPFSPRPGFDLLVLSRYVAVAESGTYSLIVSGAAPSRFLLSMGQEGSEFDGVLRGEKATREQLAAWYSGAP